MENNQKFKTNDIVIYLAGDYKKIKCEVIGTKTVPYEYSSSNKIYPHLNCDYILKNLDELTALIHAPEMTLKKFE